MERTARQVDRKYTGRALLELLQEVGPFAIAGLVGALVLLFLFALLTEDVFSNEITSLDNGASLWVHSFANPALDTFFTALSDLGGPIGIPVLAVLAFGLLFWDKRLHDAWRVVLVVVGGLIINEALKQLFHRTRPDLWPGLSFAGFSFPSGHATLSVCLFGLFAWLGWRYMKSEAARVGWTVLMVLLILLIGLSRIYLGAHFLSDVVAGYLSAGVWLLAVLSGAEIFHRIREQRKMQRSDAGSVDSGGHL